MLRTKYTLLTFGMDLQGFVGIIDSKSITKGFAPEVSRVENRTSSHGWCGVINSLCVSHKKKNGRYLIRLLTPCNHDALFPRTQDTSQVSPPTQLRWVFSFLEVCTDDLWFILSNCDCCWREGGERPGAPGGYFRCFFPVKPPKPRWGPRRVGNTFKIFCTSLELPDLAAVRRRRVFFLLEEEMLDKSHFYLCGRALKYFISEIDSSLSNR